MLKTLDDRRYAVIYSAQQCAADLARDGMDGDYFPRLWRWYNDGGFRAVNHWLRTRELAEAYNPAGSCHRAPVTTSTHRAIEESRPEVAQRILEAIAEGVVGFRGGWISSIALSMLFERDRVSVKARRQSVLSLGYVAHPGLPNGRASAPLMVDGDRRPTLYVLPGSLNCNYSGHAVGHAYERAQNAPLATGEGVAECR